MVCKRTIDYFTYSTYQHSIGRLSKYVTKEKASTYKKAIAHRGDIVITHRGTLGQISFIPENSKYDSYVISQSQFRVRLKRDKADPAFFVYYFHTSEGQKRLLSFKNHVGVPALAQATTNFRKLEIPLPDLPVQQKIAAVLSALDAKIELNQRINAELESMAKTLYDYWFVQFDFPFDFAQGKPDLNGKPYKSSGGKMVWNEELKREIPLGWTAKKVREFAETSSGGTPLSTKKEYYKNGTIPWINSGELNDPFIVTGSSFITEAGLNNSSAKMFPVNSVLVALYGATAGKVSLLRIEACTNQAVCALLPKSPIYINFLKYGFGNLYNYLVALSSGSARDNLSQEIIRNITFAMPPNDNLLEEFNKIVNPALEKIVINLRESQTLTELRDWLLPMLMNGQVTVK